MYLFCYAFVFDCTVVPGGRVFLIQQQISILSHSRYCNFPCAGFLSEEENLLIIFPLIYHFWNQHNCYRMNRVHLNGVHILTSDLTYDLQHPATGIRKGFKSGKEGFSLLTKTTRRMTLACHSDI